jgi:hypothetical protein
MISINYPEPAFRIKREGEKPFIFDALRKQWLVLTPEEWVRQNFVQYLIRIKEYPSTLIAQEKKILLGELTKRFDILVYDNAHKPWLMVECKGAEIKLNESVLEQALRYNISVPVQFIFITNGNSTYGWKKTEIGLEELKEVPAWVGEE